jgi:O-antigen/teichoic acid export membrane protein
MLQAWFNLLDMGLTPTMARETARFRGCATDALTYRRLVHALEGVFVLVAVAGGTALFGAAGYIATKWLHAKDLPIAEVRAAVRLIAVVVALRWMSGLYRGAITGSEKLVWLGTYNALVATLRFLLVLPILMFIGTTPTIFFRFQLGVALLEVAGLMWYAYELLPSVPRGEKVAWSWAPLKPVLKFSLTIAFTSSVWVVVTQTDKLVLSKLMPLAEYGYYTLAVLAASGILMVSAPVSGAIMPRMARLEAEGDHNGLIAIYRESTQLVAILAGAATVTLVCFAEPLLWIWTANRDLAHRAAPILVLYAIGNGVLAVAAFPYYLQFAKGDLRLHLIGNAAFVIVLIPAIIWAAGHYGGVGAGFVWLGMNLLSFVAWLPFVHHRFAPGLNAKWYFEDVLTIELVAVMAGYASRGILREGAGRWSQVGGVVAFGSVVVFAGVCASSMMRRHVGVWLRRAS